MARNNPTVASHCPEAVGVKAAMLEGFKLVEYASLVDNECIILVKVHGVIVVATRSVQDYDPRRVKLFSVEGLQKSTRIHVRDENIYAKAIRADVKMTFDMDIALSSPAVSFLHQRYLATHPR